ncbi:MAG: hypothetical protein Q9O62_06705 [Ardenticatenia bacterium]|nr:hypothetical protein [Ardenticatenia bacterium]
MGAYLRRGPPGGRGCWSPFLAGIFTFAHSRFVYLSLGQFNIAARSVVPWYVLALWRLASRARWRDVELGCPLPPRQRVD